MKPEDDLSWIDQVGQPVIVATHPRSGTHLVLDFIRKQFADCRSWKYLAETKNHLYLDIDPLLFSSRICKNDRDKIRFAQKILKRAKHPTIKTHCLKRHLDHHSQWSNKLIEKSKIVYVVRDGRSVLCSLHPFVKGYSEKAQCSFRDFIRQESNGMSRCKKWANHVTEWMNTPDILFIRFEDVIKNTEATLAKIGEHLDLKPLYINPLLPKSIQSRRESIWLALTQLSPESTTHMNFSDQPKGKKYTELFSPEDRAFFQQETGDLLVRLGYESSDAWVQ